MPDYQQGKIYTIRCRTDDTLIYVGSTIQSLAVRWGGHKKDSKQEKNKNMLIYTTINNDWSNWYYELYELYPCSCKQELDRKEGEIIRLIGTLNKNIAGRTPKEYVEANKEKKTEYAKSYEEANKEKRTEQHKAHYEANKEKKLEKSKAYYEANKEKRVEYQRQYRQRKKQINNIPI